MTNDSMTKKKYNLRPGNHQFAPGSHAIHHNDNLSDAEAEWYIEKYPHIANLFIPQQLEQELETQMPLIQNEVQYDHITPPSGGRGAAI